MDEDRLERALKRAEKTGPKASVRQVKWLDTLFIDLGYTTRQLRNLYLSREFDREIRFLDELSASEASGLIERLLAKKEG